MVSKREKNFILKIDPIHVPTNLNMADIAKKLREHLNKLYNLIDKVRQVHLNETLDITHGSMASQTAEAVFLTLNNGITFLNSYFPYIGEIDLLTKMSAQYMTTKLLECFFGHLTQGVQAKNLRYLEIKRRIANDTFTFLQPYINFSDSGVTVRSEKERAVETYSYSQHDLTIENWKMIWQLLVAKNTKLLTINKISELKNTIKEIRVRKKACLVLDKSQAALIIWI